MRLEQSIPDADFPLGEAHQSCRLQWFQCDTLFEYRNNDGHPLYGENDVSYAFNSRGYRCPEFDATADLRMLSIGCSVTFGLGLPQQAIFHERLAQRLRTELGCSVVNWNLGLSGAGNDALCRILHLAVPRLDPHLVVVNFTYLGRREYFLVTNERFRYLPADLPMNRTLTEVRQHFQALSSPFDDQAQFFRHYKSIEALLRGRHWFYSFGFIKQFDCGSVAGHLDRARQVEDPGECDKARDWIHPGPQSHEQLYEGYWQKLVATDTVDQLRERVGSKTPPDAERSYRELIQEIRRLVRAVIPRGSTVLVCSKGDEQLLQLEGVRAWHFPRLGDGTYAGCYPADSREAVAQLEAARQQGAQYLLVPSPALWWLSHYNGLQDYLQRTGELFWLGPPCALFALHKPRGSLRAMLRKLWSERHAAAMT